jgi:phosphonate transport system substrate-binding protein
MVHDLAPDLRDKIVSCTFAFKFPNELMTAFRGTDRFVPLDFKRDYALVRKVADMSGEAFTKSAFERRKANEASTTNKLPSVPTPSNAPKK